jgi:ribosomal protein S18 acetylase RimI-like enzyme
MSVRQARRADRPAIRDVARRSLQASYSLEAGAISTAIEQWYGEETLAEMVDSDDRELLVADAGGQVVGFSEVTVSGDGIEATLLWLHVDPAHRGEDVAANLLEETRARLDDRDVERLFGRVLEDNADGNEFYDAHGFEQTGQSEVDIAGRTQVENVYVDADRPGLEALDQNGETVYVDRAESDTGSMSNFYVVYSDPDAEEKYGYFCGNCETLANAMDASGRVECDNCGNARKPTRWDAAYL